MAFEIILNNIEHYDVIDQYEDLFWTYRLPKTYIRDASNPFALHPEKFQKRYRFVQESVFYITSLLKNDLVKQNQRGLPIAPEIAVLLTEILRYSFISVASWSRLGAHITYKLESVPNSKEDYLSCVMQRANEVMASPAEQAGDVEDGVRVRVAERGDMQRVRDMIQELAEFEGMPAGPELTVEDLVRDGFECSPPWFFALLAEAAPGGEPLGQALVTRAYSSWTGRSFYLEDLFVRPEARRRGVASRLLRHLCRVAAAEGARRVDWHVLESNAGALALYARAGARDLRASEGRAALRLDAPRIQAVAAGRMLPLPLAPDNQLAHLLPPARTTTTTTNTTDTAASPLQ